jgi:hypothetical protein
MGLDEEEAGRTKGKVEILGDEPEHHQVGKTLVTRKKNEGESFGKTKGSFPIAEGRVGQYPVLVKSGGGYLYDKVLEYRVWVHDIVDHFRAFKTYEEALRYSRKTPGAEEPLALVLQKPGHWVWLDEKHGSVEIGKTERIAEWKVEWLLDHKYSKAKLAKVLEELGAKKPPAHVLKRSGGG